MSKVVSINSKQEEHRRRLVEYVEENCDSWDSCMIVARSEDGALSIITSNDEGVEFLGMIELAKTLLIDGIVND